MRYGLAELADSPTVPFMSLAEAKTFLKVDFAEDDDLIESLVEAAVGDCEAYCNAAFVPRTFVLTQAGFGSYCGGHPRRYPGGIYLPVYPLISITSVQYLDADNALQSVATVDSVVVSSQRPPFIAPAADFTWPAVYGHPEAVTITFRAGFEQVPKSIVAAVSFRLGQLYRHRDETDLELPASVASLLRNHRLWPLP